MRRISLAGVSFRGGAVLLGQRRPGTSIGVRWEFPGGKLESDESPEDGLKREFQEELGVRILPLSHFFSGEFTNKGKEYLLKAYWVKLLSADFSYQQHQRLEWVSLQDLANYDLADSDRLISEYILHFFF
jgi:8-oxo-dGTP diphosphatase